MKRCYLKLRRHGLALIMTVLALLAVTTGSLTLGSKARTPGISITIANSSTSLEVHRVFFSPTDKDKWSPDQLGDSVIAPGSSTILNNVSCDGADLKVIAEDQNGCFLYHVVTCGDNATWTITNDSTPDCGS